MNVCKCIVLLRHGGTLNSRRAAGPLVRLVEGEESQPACLSCAASRKEENGVWEYLWPTLRCRREAGVSPLLSIGWWYLSSVFPKRHCCRVSAADKGCRVYPLDPSSDAVALYSGCTPGKRRAWFFPDDRHTASLVGLRGGWRHAKMKLYTRFYGSNAVVPGPKLPSTIKAGYLNCKIHPYIPNPLRSFKCQRFGHSQTSCRGQLTCSRCASVGHASTDCSLEQKCVNCSEPHFSDSKLCPKWKTEKEIQIIKTNRNISYLEARKLIAPQLSQTYAQVTNPLIATSTTQTDENITKIKCPPLQLLKPLSSLPQPNAAPSIPSVSTLSSTTQTNLLPIKLTTQIESRLPEPISASAAAPDNSLNTSTSSSSAETCPVPTTFNKFAALQPSVPLSESATTTTNSELSNTSKPTECKTKFKK
ncbi:uncharacterized protein TNCV_3001331 [Trichonephila clavipes]|nr:uncharacterized protein TNCV_3001331 [Trichonephila clavipes]